MMNIDPKSIVDTRIQLHWSSQLLSAAADAQLDKADDDSHSNLGWNASTSQMVGRTGCAIDIVNFTLLAENQSLPLDGCILDSAQIWLSKILGVDLRFRDYDMPDHGVSSGDAFSPQLEQLKSISEWLSFAEHVLQDHGELRIWPHHFDMGFWNPLTNKGKSIGGGFSLGDEHFNQPYFYVNPYGIERPETLPALPIGQWADGWLGAILTAEELRESKNHDPDHTARDFVMFAIEKSKTLLSQ